MFDKKHAAGCLAVVALITLGAVLALAQVVAPATPTPAPAAPQPGDLKAKQLIDQMIEALGGNAYLNLNDSSQEGRSYSFHHGEPTSTGLLYWRFTRFPDKERVELTKQRDVVYVYNGNQSWELTFKGVKPGDPKEMVDYLRHQEHSLETVLRLWLHKPGVALLYEGTGIAEQKPAEKVTVLARNDSVTIYLDPTTHLPIKKTYVWRDPEDKQKNTEEDVYDNYRPVQGVMTPFSFSRVFNGEIASQRFLNSIKYNTGMSDDVFVPKR